MNTGRARFVAPTLVLIGIAGICFVWLLKEAWPFTADDAFITFRYSENLVRGYGLRFNPGGPPVEGYTAVLWMLFMAIPHLLGMDPVTFSKVSGVIGTVGVAVVVFALIKRMLPSNSGFLQPLLPWIGAATLCCSPVVAIHAVSGMETALATLCATAFFYLTAVHVEAPSLRTAVLLPLTALAAGLNRPELNPPLFLGLAVTELLIRRDERVRLGMTVVLLYVLPGLVYFIWRYVHFQTLFPLPFYLKIGADPLVDGWREVLSFIRYMGVHVGVLVLIGLVRVDTRLRPALATAAAMTGILVFVRPIMAYQWRYLYPLMPFLVAIAVIGIGRISHWMEDHRPPLMAWSKALTVGIILITWLGFLTDPSHAISDRRAYAAGLSSAHVTLGKHLGSLRNTGDNPILAIGDAGAVPYYSGWETIDTYGLNDPYMARTTDPDPSHVLSRNPDLVVLLSGSGTTFEPCLKVDGILYRACLAGGMGAVKVLRFSEHYFLWVMGRPENPYARAVAESEY